MATENSNRPLRTGDALVAMGVISRAQLYIALQQQSVYYAQGLHLPVGEVLVRNRFATQAQVKLAVARVTAGGAAGLFTTLLPFNICIKHRVVPVRAENDALVVRAATALTETQKNILAAACAVSVSHVRVIPADRREIEKSIANFDVSRHGFSAVLERLKQREMTGSLMHDAIESILHEALGDRASDIRLDRKSEVECFVSLRIDNIYHRRYLVPERIMGALFVRLKNESGMDASLSTRPQDGRLSLQYNGRLVDFRVAAQPVYGGETLTLRVLDRESMPSIEALIPYQLEMAEHLRGLTKIQGKMGGLVLMTGPTGQGKTTTLYALAERFPRDTMNIVTVEDPVEYQMPLSSQIQLNALTGQRAQDIERSILRQDPDVLVFGEIRDADSARTALAFAESGHLVLTTIHANSAVQSFERFISFFHGDEVRAATFVLAHNLRAIVNQRLVARLCSCARPVTDDEYTKLCAPLGLKNKFRASMPVGCPRCGGTGTYGRVLAHESLFLPISPEVRSRIHDVLFSENSRFDDVRRVEGVRYISREETLRRLTETGVVEPRVAKVYMQEEAH